MDWDNLRFVGTEALARLGWSLGGPTGPQLREYVDKTSTTWQWTIRVEPTPGRTLLSPFGEDRTLTLVLEGQNNTSNKNREITTQRHSIYVMTSTGAIWDRIMETLKDIAWILASVAVP